MTYSKGFKDAIRLAAEVCKVTQSRWLSEYESGIQDAKNECYEAILALKPEAQVSEEPVAWLYENDWGTGRKQVVLSSKQVDHYYVGLDKEYIKGKPLYLHSAPTVSDEPKCSNHPDAPHGFLRSASHTAGRYVCECEGWEPPVSDEPVAWFDSYFNNIRWREGIINSDLYDGQPLYLHPAPPVSDEPVIVLAHRDDEGTSIINKALPDGTILHPTPNASAEMERDAARYMYLKKEMADRDGWLSVSQWTSVAWETLHEYEIDAAIDAAMEGKS